jgi:hypothetical protein
MYHNHRDAMKTEDFADFVASQQRVDADVDWAGMRDEWLRELDSLHANIAHFLEEYTAAGSISYSFAEVELTEPDIGQYLAKRMDIKIGRQHVSLVPVGTLLVGCKGRVDAQGSAGRAQILLVDERARSAVDLIKVAVNVKGSAPASAAARKPPSSWAWKILTNAAQKQFVDLDKESFFALLMEIANA